MKDFEGEYKTWKWDAARKCYEAVITARIYPTGDNKFVTSYDGVWNTSKETPKSLREAELSALEIEL
jgi:hypothetical protein